MSHLNLRWTLQEMDMVKQRVNEGWRADDIAGLLDITEAAAIELLVRNGFPVHPRRKRKGVPW